MVDLNYLCVQEDAALAELRASAAAASGQQGGGGEDQQGQRQQQPARPRALVGVWPEAALLNHSCAPNAAAVAVDGRLLARAARPVAKQAELTVSYLPGPLLLAPLRARQRALRGARGFKCRCLRCRDEAKLDPNLLALVDDIVDACGCAK